MHLKSLTLKGFKSFASATTLHLEPGITCVVGPNGSGKSNVVDAIAWVMGEQGAKSLRGGKMEDVIFAGTSGRAPLGRAEVSLTIDNTDGALPIEYSEVTITRTLFRNGGSEYAINGNQCRLLDVQELLSDSGIGREMHVVVGQGQLDTVLQATPEDRRGFIEEAAGVLKHRKRKEKALRKLESMQANLVRLTDLTSELRRQLKPLARQAEVAKRAQVIQADVRDARLRLLADDLVRMRTTMAQETADETALREHQAEVEAALLAARAREALLAEELAADAPRLTQVQETWFRLSGLRERFLGTRNLAAERVRRAADDEAADEGAPRIDPEALDAEAKAARDEQFALSREVETARALLSDAAHHASSAREALVAEDRRVQARARAAADRREGLARLAGQVGAAKSRVDARTAEIDRLETQVQAARARADEALAKFKSLESQVAGLDEGEYGLDADHEAAEEALAVADQVVADLRAEEQRVDRERAAHSATVQALAMSLERRDGVADLIDAGIAGVLGPVSTVVTVEPGYEAAAAAALGPLAEALAVQDVNAAVEALARLRAHDSGSVHLLVAGAPAPETFGGLPSGARWAVDVLRADESVMSSLRRALSGVVVVDDLEQAVTVTRFNPGLSAVTRSGEVLSAAVARGGSGAPSRLEVQAALDEATRALEAATSRGESIRFELVTATAEQERALSRVEAALERLHESDARLAAVAEQLAQLGQVARAAQAEADRFAAAQQAAVQSRDADLGTLNELQERLAAAESEPDEGEADPSERAALAAAAEEAAQREVEARLSLRTLEERHQSVAERADRAERAAAAERAARERAVALRERRAREAQVAAAVLSGADIVLERLASSLAQADHERSRGEALRAARESELTALRGEMRELTGELERLVDSVHRDEVARAEQRLRIEQLEERAVSDLGVEPDILIAEYGPDQLVPPTIDPEADPEAPIPDAVPYDRVAQERRLAAAEKSLNLLGKINPLALEEFDALEERHRFLTEQLDDLKKSRADLLEVVREVDERVQQVFGEAYEDVQREFEQVFARLFPGGEGRLILTDPENLLTTGVDIEARPPGKKVKRLSLLSGGERSLTAVAFLVALFKARPNPFYILDEVEAALDDTNLGRLLEIYEELRDHSQLLVVTHQKRTMEVADALYGISMRGDGISTVVSQRLRERETA